MPLRLSILDQSPIPEGLTAGDALRNTVDLAKLADDLGYHRYWLAEHHGTPGLADSSPEVIVGPVAAATSKIRVGTGGVMLPHYSPLKVAETFHMLSSMFPGRIDLGIGRAPGTSGAVSYALQRDRRQPPPDDFPQQLGELLNYFSPEAKQPFPQLPAVRLHGLGKDPSAAEFPAPWLLGSSPQSAVWAAELGLPYCFADFINPEGAGFAHVYRQNFVPSKWSNAPRMAIAAWAICAETDEEAMLLSASFRMMSLHLFRGQLIPVPPIDKALEFLKGEGLPMHMLPAGRRVITGSPEKVRASLQALAEKYQAEEVLVVNIMFDHAARKRSYELIAKAWANS
jgi:luciferase family oxidoreductase group 1